MSTSETKLMATDENQGGSSTAMRNVCKTHIQLIYKDEISLLEDIQSWSILSLSLSMIWSITNRQQVSGQTCR